MNNKKKQHYVPKAYLRQWGDEKGNIWALRENKIFKTKIKRICEEKSFYKAKLLNDDEKRIINFLLSKIDRPYREYSLEIISFIQNNVFQSEVLKKVYKEFNNKKIEQIIQKMIDDSEIYNNNIIEDCYSVIDYYLSQEITKILNNEFQDVVDDENTIGMWFLLIAFQLFRTNKGREIGVLIANDININGRNNIDVDWDKIILYMPFVHCFQFTANLFKMNYQIKILHNQTSEPFITSDFPVLNIKRDVVDEKGNVKEFIVFYPISPKTGLLFTNKESSLDINKEKDIECINKKMIESSYKTIIFDSKDTANKYKSYANQCFANNQQILKNKINSFYSDI